MVLLSVSLVLLLVLLLHVALGSSQLEFPSGVASGEVTKSTAVLWVAADRAVTVKVYVFDNPELQQNSCFQATTATKEEDGFTAKIVAEGLDPDTTYYYQWRKGSISSDVGTFRTAPNPTDKADLRFTYSGDSDGLMVSPGVPLFNHFEVLDAARQEGGDFFFYLGDLVYADSFPGQELALLTPAKTLEEFRNVWKTNRKYDALKNLLRSTSIFSVWDDHEVRDNWDQDSVDSQLIENGRKAYFEYVPSTEDGLLLDPTCAANPLFKVFPWGSLAEIIVLDERSCRSKSAAMTCQGAFSPILDLGTGAPPDGCLDELNSPSRTFLGPVQKKALKDALLTSTAKFKLIMSGLGISQGFLSPYDRWEGYAAERAEILNFIRSNGIENVIFLTTDNHANIISPVFIDKFTDREVIAYEFIVGPIAAATLKQNLARFDEVLGFSAVGFLQAILFDNGSPCQVFDKDGYGLVEISSEHETATVTLKDENGTVLTDDITGQPCTLVLGDTASSSESDSYE